MKKILSLPFLPQLQSEKVRLLRPKNGSFLSVLTGNEAFAMDSQY